MPEHTSTQEDRAREARILKQVAALLSEHFLGYTIAVGASDGRMIFKCSDKVHREEEPI